MVQTLTEAQAKHQAEYEAKIQRCQAGVRKLNENVYSVPSESERAPHIVTVVDGQARSCTCKWFTEAGWRLHKCAHAQATERYIANQEAIEEATAYIRLRDGSLVQATAQARDRERGQFSLLR